jgi:hypothetical protein
MKNDCSPLMIYFPNEWSRRGGGKSRGSSCKRCGESVRDPVDIRGTRLIIGYGVG